MASEPGRSRTDARPAWLRAPSRCWTAQWLWAPHAPETNAWALFRYEFELAQLDSARLLITADTRYRLWVNGERLGDGPPQSQPYHQYYDTYPLGDVLRPGANCIAVLAHHQGLQPHTRGGLLCELVDGDGKVIASTGADWRCRVAGAWRKDTHFFRMNKIGPFQEHVDLRKIPDGWTQVGFDDDTWDQPVLLSTRGRTRPPGVMPWCRLLPRDIAPLEERPAYATALQCVEECLDVANRQRSEDLSISLSQVGRDVGWARIEDADALLGEDGEAILSCSRQHRDRVTDGRYDPCVTLDFGRVLTAYAEIELEASSGAKIEIGYAERLVDGRFNNTIECPFADAFSCRDGRNVYRPLVWRSFRYLRLRIKNAENAVRIRAVRAVEVRYPFEYRGTFAGDKRLEDVFAICRNTVELCSIESLMDTPQREQAQWLGDVAAVTVPAIYACFGDTSLPGKFLRQAAMNTQPTGLIANVSNVVPNKWNNDIPDYSLWWVLGLWRHVLYSGDDSCLHECYPEMQRVMRVHLERINDRGLIEDMFAWVFIDWAFVDRRGMCAAYNAIFAGACDAAAELARRKGDAWAERQYTAAAAGVREAFRDAFYDVDAGIVVDALADGKRSPEISEHANAAAVAFDCLDAETNRSVLQRVFVDRSVDAVEAQPFFMVVVLAALHKAGMTDVALELTRERWGRMLDRGQTSCSEEWYANGSWRSGDWMGFMRTLSHAWSACPGEFLIAGLAGVEILEPGCRKLRVSPHRASFPYKVTYPTPHGDVQVEWNGQTTHVDAPDGVTIEQSGNG